MLIGSWDIKNADARQSNVKPGFHSLKNKSEWNTGAAVPVMFRSEIGFKTFSVILVVKTEGGRQAILSRCSEILSHLTEPQELTLDGFDHKFYAVMTKFSHEETAMRRWHKLTLEFQGYEYASAETVQSFSGATEFMVANAGNIATPAVIEITPQIGVASIQLAGICRDPETGEDLPVTVRELKAGNKVVLDGQKALFTQDGRSKAGDIDIWERPTLLPGSNTITINSSRMDITVRFHPRFM